MHRLEEEAVLHPKLYFSFFSNRLVCSALWKYLCLLPTAQLVSCFGSQIMLNVEAEMNTMFLCLPMHPVGSLSWSHRWALACGFIWWLVLSFIYLCVCVFFFAFQLMVAFGRQFLPSASCWHALVMSTAEKGYQCLIPESSSMGGLCYSWSIEGHKSFLQLHLGPVLWQLPCLFPRVTCSCGDCTQLPCLFPCVTCLCGDVYVVIAQLDVVIAHSERSAAVTCLCGDCKCRWSLVMILSAWLQVQFVYACSDWSSSFWTQMWTQTYNYVISWISSAQSDDFVSFWQAKLRPRLLTSFTEQL